MEKARQIIEKNKVIFGDHLIVIYEIESHRKSQPDIAIGCCKSLFEGVGKTILSRENPGVMEKNDDAHQVFKKAVRQIEGFEMNEGIMLGNLASIIREIATIRNKRDPIAHGKASPLEYKSSPAIAEFVISITDTCIFYTILKYTESLHAPVTYEANPTFNEYLDEGKENLGISYSKALFDQDFNAYAQELENYLDSLS